MNDRPADQRGADETHPSNIAGLRHLATRIHDLLTIVVRKIC